MKLFAAIHWIRTISLYGIRISVKLFMVRFHSSNFLPIKGPRLLDEKEFLMRLKINPEDLLMFKREFAEIYSKSLIICPHQSGIKEKSGFILFTLVRKYLPKKIFESGFQSGRSTYIILQALNLNGQGSLSSLDIIKRTIPESIRGFKNFNLYVIKMRIQKFYGDLILRESPDFWFLDSDNRFYAQLTELRAARKSSKIILVNNAHVSNASDKFWIESGWLQFSFSEGERTLTLFLDPNLFNYLDSGQNTSP